MRDEVRRINKLVAEGKLTPEDAADLIDAFYASDREEGEPEHSGPTPPPPPPGAVKDPFKGIVDQIEKLTKEGIDAVDWKEVSKQARESARKGFDFLRTGIEDISKGKVNINFFGVMERKDVSLPLTIGEGKTLKIENACGDVIVSGGKETGQVTAMAKFRGSSIDDAKSKAQGYTLIIEESDHHVIIRQPDVSGLSVDLDIHVAGSVNLEIKTAAGDIHVSDTGGSCRVAAGAGDIHLSGLNGPVDINSGSGDIFVRDCETSSLNIEDKSGSIDIKRVRGNMNVRTATGDLDVTECTGKVIALESITGDVNLDLTEPISGSVNVRTVNGDAHIGVPDGSDCRVSLSTLRGDVSCEMELQDEAKAQQRITGKLGEGTGTLDVSAVTGDVALEMRKTPASAV
jgi:hypothetical protein